MEATTSIYKDIATRTGGDIYIGVVGPVRTGKSTLIKRFMEHCVLPQMEEGAAKERAKDEMPQSGSGKNVMTTEPKFVPDEGVQIQVGETFACRVKLIDCVGFVVPEAAGLSEDGIQRMVNTPWSSEPMPFEEAAKLGTQKVISEHATVGIVVTTDGKRKLPDCRGRRDPRNEGNGKTFRGGRELHPSGIAGNTRSVSRTGRKIPRSRIGGKLFSDGTRGNGKNPENHRSGISDPRSPSFPSLLDPLTAHR